ncbi:hypothetical protein CAPTEDRAFT_192882 [Capitella teleta]|uniref:Uncharacterized protein n=1 Tax=Capitella teleta TaxID=283909 RepID=R7TWJ4_CAPTE|nr:hypothetical protein CAPTEDRAFT_192882 [Capitella teleta]|eukprot:ELT98283.1 hypothetical protein CAPTEDRAFT_192882 [Capitella teleta]
MGNRNITTAREVQLPTDEEQGTGTVIWFDQKKITAYFRDDQDQMRILLVAEIPGSEPCGLEFPYVTLVAQAEEAIKNFSQYMKDEVKSSLNRDVKEGDIQAYYPIEFNINNAEKIAQNSAMISLAYESKFKFLPFCLGDLYNILTLLGSLPGADEVASMHRIRSAYPIILDVSVTPSCMPSSQPWKYVSVDSLGPLKNLLGMASYLVIWNADDNPGLSYSNHKSCTVSQGLHSDAPFILEECCQMQKQTLNGNYEINVVCQDAQRMRKFLCTIILCFTWVVLVFCPLLVTCLPSRRAPTAKKKQSTPTEQTDDTTVELSEQKTEILDSNKNEQEDQDDLSRRWIFLDTDPVHTLSSSIWAIIIKYLLHSPHRESGVMLPKLIFALGILSYIRQAFVDFNDKYRKLKFSVFSSALDMDGFNRVLQCDGRTPLLRISGPHGFEQSLPRKVFDRVCDVLDPHQANVGSTTVKLTTSLLTISIFFVIIWEYQIFDDVTETSEAFLSLITVSIPRLFGAMKSAGYQKVREARKSNAIQVILEQMTVPRCS